MLDKSAAAHAWRCETTPRNRRWHQVLKACNFVPLTVFVLYASWGGQDEFTRWLQAFEYGALLAIVQLWCCRHFLPLNKLMLAADLYLLLGGVASVSDWHLVQLLLDHWRASGLFLWIAVFCLACTLFHPAGCLSQYGATRQHTILASRWLCLASCIALLPSLLSSWSLLYSAFVPLVLLSVLEKNLCRQLTARH